MNLQPLEDRIVVRAELIESTTDFAQAVSG